MYKFDTIEDAIQDIKKGKMVIVIDDEDRENEGDLLMAAEAVTAEAINFMAKYGRGLICAPAEKAILQNLDIGDMVYHNTDNHGTAFTVSIDHVGTSTGISAEDRALTIKELANPNAKAEDFRRPGHIFPLVAKDMGVLERIGHTEAAVDLAKLGGFKGIGIICEIMADDGTMMRTPELMEFAKTHDLKFITIKDLVQYRKNHSVFMTKEVETRLPTKYGEFSIQGFIDTRTQEHHLALVKGDISKGENILTRIHSECLTGDVFGSQKCDCGEQLDAALKMISENGTGVLLYLRQEGRGIGLVNKLKAYVLQEQGFDTVEANHQLGFPTDMRDYSVAAQMYKLLGVKSVTLLTNNPEKIQGLTDQGIKISERLPLQFTTNSENHNYIQTKKDKLLHLID